MNEIEVARVLYNQQRERQLPDEFVFQWLNRIGAIDNENIVNLVWGRQEKFNR